jgi:hypothetical protein
MPSTYARFDTPTRYGGEPPATDLTDIPLRDFQSTASTNAATADIIVTDPSGASFSLIKPPPPADTTDSKTGFKEHLSTYWGAYALGLALTAGVGAFTGWIFWPDSSARARDAEGDWLTRGGHARDFSLGVPEEVVGRSVYQQREGSEPCFSSDEEETATAGMVPPDVLEMLVSEAAGDTSVAYV